MLGAPESLDLDNLLDVNTVRFDTSGLLKKVRFYLNLAYS